MNNINEILNSHLFNKNLVCTNCNKNINEVIGGFIKCTKYDTGSNESEINFDLNKTILEKQFELIGKKIKLQTSNIKLTENNNFEQNYNSLGLGS